MFEIGFQRHTCEGKDNNLTENIFLGVGGIVFLFPLLHMSERFSMFIKM